VAIAVNYESAASTFAFNYPDSPVIYSVSGCLVPLGNGTGDCPTDGLINGLPVTLTITGVVSSSAGRVLLTSTPARVTRVPHRAAD
jgi:hypothetical protein